MTVNKELEFREGFSDLQDRSYQDILGGVGVRLEDVRAAIKVVHDIR